MTAATEIVRRDPNSFGGSRPPAPGSQATAIEQQRAIAEVQAAVIVAQSCPRDMAEAEREMEYVCGRLDMAEQAFYQVTNRGTGPSVHLMRELARIWGNVDYGVKELHRDDDRGVSEVQAFAWDQQRNTRSSRTFINPHQRMVKVNGIQQRKDLTDLQDIYLSNANIGARAVRECIAAILPRWFTEKAQNLCHNTLKYGEGKPLVDRIAALVNAFDGIGVTVAQLEARLEKPRADWTPEDVAQLTVAGQSIRRGEARKDELFPPVESSTADEIAAAPPAEDEKPKRTRKPRGSKADAEKAAENEQTTDETPPQETRGGDGDTNEAATKVENTTADPAPGQQGEAAQRDLADRETKTPMRKALEKRLFTLIGAIDSPESINRDDRIAIYRHVIGRKDIASTDDLDNVEVGKVCDQLYTWQQDGALEAKVVDIIIAADSAAAETGGTEQK
jgi:hypothetical protein